MRSVRVWAIAACAAFPALSGHSQVQGLAASEKAGRFTNIQGSGFSGWRGGTGIAFGSPGTKIPDVTELGYEVCWGSEEPKVCSVLNIAMFAYWNSIVEMGLTYKSSKASYDFSAMADKDEAARLAFDAWAEVSYGAKGLSKYASVRYFPQGTYGDVIGKMDLSSENPLTLAVIETQLKRFTSNKLTNGGIGIDNLSTVPGNFIGLLKSRLNPHGLGIAVNSFPKALGQSPYVGDIDVAGAEGFPYSVEFAREIRARGFKGILCEFTMQHLSAAELAAYLKAKLFYGIVFFGYTDGGGAACSQYSFYAGRPDVYNHQRWVFRKYVPLSRALFGAGGQECPCAELKTAAAGALAANDEDPAQPDMRPDGSGAIYEKGQLSASVRKLTGMSPATRAGLFRFGDRIGSGIYYFVSSPKSEIVACDARKLNLDAGTRVFDEINERMIDGELTNSALRFSTAAGPSVVQLGTREVIAKNLVARMASLFAQADLQKALEQTVKIAPLHKTWAPFCQGWAADPVTARSGRASMKTLGGKYDYAFKKWKYDNRQGGAQLVALNQKVPLPVTLCAWSKADAVPASSLASVENRRAHFICREANTYAMHLYLDYQDGEWPEIHTAAFSAGTHDWEKRTITVNPGKPVKTAMVLLEFQQPSGAAWFDDVSLVEGKDGANVLAYAGFEKFGVEGVDPEAVRKAYEAGVDGLRSRIRKAGGQGPVTRSDVENIRKDAIAAETRLLKSGAASLFGRELRDVRNVRHLADVAVQVLGTK